MTAQQVFTLALQHHQAGRLAQADALYHQVLAEQPNHVDALHFLGVLAHQVGRHDLAVERIRQAVALQPNNPAALSNLGEAYRAAGQLDEAITAFHRALQLKANHPEAEINLGIALSDRGQLNEAVAAFRRAIEFKPDYVLAHYNLGIALTGQGKLDEGIAAYRRALQLQPDYSEAWNNLGAALAEQGRLDEAVAAHCRALQLQPEDSAAYINLGVALYKKGRLMEAIAAYSRAIQLQPDYPEAHNNLGLALAERRQFDEATAAYRRALELKPNYPDAHLNLGGALLAQGQLDEAVAAYQKAMELQPQHPSAHSHLLYALHFHSGYDAGMIMQEQQRWSRNLSDPLQCFLRAHANDRSPERRLRIGYVSPYFGDNVLGRNLVPLMRCHDRRQFEILCYSGVSNPDRFTEAFRQRADHWRSTLGVGDAALAEMIRQDGVDLLVDLSVHALGNRLPVFARQPAPVQVSFAGYPASTGLGAIGYRISDHYMEGGSAETGTGNREQVCLIDSFWCYDPCAMELEVNALPAQEHGRVTFGCLNNFCKLNEPVLRLWARVLAKVKDSRLVVLSPEGHHRQRTREILMREGVEAHRVEFVAPRPRKAYMELHHRLDLILDPFPYNGHPTSLDALWMGVPVVSLAGEQSVSRAGYSELSNLGLPELIAFSQDDYLGIATLLARDLPRLAELRVTLRPRMEASPLMDAPRFARNMEAAYRTMWQRWCTEKQS